MDARMRSNSRIRIDPPRPARRLDGSDPLLGQGLVVGAAELPAIALRAVVSAGGLDVDPEVGDLDVVVVDGFEEGVELCFDGFAGDTVCGARA